MFTTLLYDVIIPEDVKKDDSPVDYIFLVMDYVDYDLRKMLKKLYRNSQPFSEEHIIIILYNMLCTLNFIHSAGLIHRDIKPDNILINGSCVTKLCDFGLARMCPRSSSYQNYPSTSPGGSVSRLSLSNSLSSSRTSRLKEQRELSPHVISRRYRPPEVILFEKEYSQAVDIWSLGCIVGELLQFAELAK